MMKLTVKQLIEQNNEKRKLLTSENVAYYDDLLVYIRMNKFKDERATEIVLLNLLDEILEAQKEGKCAKELFGTSPKGYADKIIESLPKESKRSIIEFGLEILFTLFGWYLVVWGIWPMINQENQTVYIGSLTVSALLLIASLLLLVLLVFKVIKNQAFSDQKKKTTATWVLGLLIGILFVVGIMSNFLLQPFGPAMKMTYYTPFGLGCFLLLASYVLKKSRENRVE
ncbi:DUF1129 family protein [Ureibacillus sp. MALMAid1270]|uniref:DUF1129 family protein n=1 Tax=Ureibacillus sp. MALMAid1270 TaxID=3411629 RepID=UPI003BA45189